MEVQQKQDGADLKAAVAKVHESIKPVNIIKNAIHSATHIEEWEENTAQRALVMGIGFLARRAIIGKTNNPVKKVLGIAIQFGINNLLTQNPVAINVLSGLWSKIRSKRESE